MPQVSRYDQLFFRWTEHETNAATYSRLISDLNLFLNDTNDAAIAPNFLVRLRVAVGANLTDALLALADLPPGAIPDDTGEVTGEAGGTALNVLTLNRDRERDAAQALLPQLFDASVGRDEGRFEANFGPISTARQLGEFGAPEGELKVLPNGDLILFDPVTKEIQFVGNFAKQGVGPADQILVQDNGDLVAINPVSGQVRVLQEGFGFAQIDPERRFALEAIQTDIAFRGLELTDRGQRIQALGQDFANQIQLGRLTFEQAQLNLNRVNSAFEVRRTEREVALAFAVKQSSIRILPDGTRVTRLPFAEQIAQRLGVPIEEFELPVGEVNPEAAAQALLDATAFESPIPVLEQQAADTAAAVDAILAESLQGTPEA